MDEPPIEVPRRRPGARGLRFGCAGALTLVLALCLCGALVVKRMLNLPDTQPHPGATREPIVGSAVLLLDRNTIAYTDPNGTCRRPSLTVTVSSTRASLALTETDAGLVDCVRFSPGMPSVLTVSLGSPLGSRELVDAMTGDRVPYFDQWRGLHPVVGTDFDASWTPYGNAPSALVATDSPFFRSPGAAIMVQQWIRSDQLTGTSMITELQLIQVSGGGWHPPPGTVTTPVTVRGHPGLAAIGIIVWTEGGITLALQGRGPSPRPTAEPFLTGGPPLDTTQLITISKALQEESP